MTLIGLGLAGCGSGSGSDRPPVQVATQNNCANPATTNDRFLITSYQSCDASDDDLTGIWIIVADYSITTEDNQQRRTQRSKRQRQLMQISNDGMGGLNVLTCNPSPGFRQSLASPSSVSISVFDEIAQANISFSVVNNVMLMGAHVTQANVFINRSSVFAIKIQDLNQSPLSTAMVTRNNNTTNFPAACFSEDSGTVEELFTFPSRLTSADTLQLFNTDNVSSNTFSFLSSTPTDGISNPSASVTLDGFAAFAVDNVEQQLFENSNRRLSFSTVIPGPTEVIVEGDVSFF